MSSCFVLTDEPLDFSCHEHTGTFPFCVLQNAVLASGKAPDQLIN